MFENPKSFARVSGTLVKIFIAVYQKIHKVAVSPSHVVHPLQNIKPTILHPKVGSKHHLSLLATVVVHILLFGKSSIFKYGLRCFEGGTSAHFILGEFIFLSFEHTTATP